PRPHHPTRFPYTTRFRSSLLEDLRECVEIVKTKEPIDSDAIRQMVGMAIQSPDPEAAFGQLAASAGLTGTDLPSEMSFINEVMEDRKSTRLNSSHVKISY